MSRRSIIASIFFALTILGFVALTALHSIPPTGTGWFMTGFGATVAIHVTPADVVPYDTQGRPLQPLSVPRAEVVLMAGRYLQEVLIPLPSWLLLTATVLCIAAAAAVLWLDRRRV